MQTNSYPSQYYTMITRKSEINTTTTVIYGFRTYKCIPVSFYHVLSSVERQKILAHPLNMVILLSQNRGILRYKYGLKQ